LKAPVIALLYVFARFKIFHVAKKINCKKLK
jgi:hypothetical protein